MNRTLFGIPNGALVHPTREFLRSQGLPADYSPVTSTKRFPDGARYRVELPSTECPKVLDAVLAKADARQVLVHRISQGSSGMLLTDDELRAMATKAAARSVELSLFARPVAGWDTSPMATASACGPVAAQARGTEQTVGASWELPGSRPCWKTSAEPPAQASAAC